LVKLYGDAPGPAGRYSPADCTGIKKTRIEGRPGKDHVSTSYVEQQNLNFRMGMRRFTRLTNGFSKKIEPHYWMVCLYTVFHISPGAAGRLPLRPCPLPLDHPAAIHLCRPLH
jgi:hypothetical protein